MGDFKTFEKASDLLLPGGTFSEVSPSGAALIIAELEQLRAAFTALDAENLRKVVQAGEMAEEIERLRAHVAELQEALDEIHGGAS